MTESEKRVGKTIKFNLVSVFILLAAGGILINNKSFLGLSSEFYSLIITISLLFIGTIIQLKSDNTDKEQIKKLEKRIEQLEKKN